MVSWCFLILLGTLIVVTEGQPGFISIDCGLTSGTSYNDSSTGIQYVSDDSYVDTGVNYNISKDYKSPSEQSSTLRSFPNGTRNCYMLQKNVTVDSTYLLRATFLYGNYDGNQSAQIGNNPLQFDLNIGTTFWRRVKITNASREYNYEVLTVAARNFIWLCLVNINKGTPFISALELRPLNKNLYSDFLYSYYYSSALLFRLNYGPTEDTIIRYPVDPYDRIWSWYEYDSTTLMSINTTENLTRYDDTNDQFDAPDLVLQTALTPVSSPNLTTTNSYDPPEKFNFDGYEVILYLAELQNFPKNQSRQFDIYLNDKIKFSAVKPVYLKMNYTYNSCWTTYNQYVLTLAQTSNSTLPPILNAIEVYWKIRMEYMTYSDDVDAIMAVKARYQIVRNWNGDPCYPINVSWYGVSCDDTSVIRSLNLSYFGLHGSISGSFAKLNYITHLNLAHNNLSGDIPDSFINLVNLRELNLLGNTIGKVPDALIKRNGTGSLTLLVDSCTNCGGAKSKRSSSTLIIAVTVAAVAILVSIAALLLILMLHRRTATIRRGVVRQNFETQVHSEIKRFTYQELKDITKSFSRIIGKGGFGIVYHGYLENQIEVAVKVCSPESGQGSKQFLAEVKSLSLVHHKNLVTLVGYCKEGDDLAVVYEYMPRGSLYDHLRGKDSTTSEHVNWQMRLNITLEAAQGLDYLHTGCGIVHRDVKSSNILLGENFEAKVSDLGLARMFSTDTKSSLITLCGTPGYIDPEYQGTLVLTEKSDVYSFGVILLEIVTGEPPIINTTESIHVIKLVKEKLDAGSIEDVIDPRLKGEYDLNSMLKVVELAMLCTNEKSTQRPTMADVVTHLRYSVQMEQLCQKEKPQQSDKSDAYSSSFSTSVGTSQLFASATR